MSKEITDERIVQTKRLVSSRGFLIFSWGILVILLYRQFYLEQSLQEYWDIFILWLIGNTYVTFGGVLKGLLPFDRNKQMRSVLVPGIIAITNLAVDLYRGTIHSWFEGILSFVLAFLGAYILLFLLYLLYHRWENRYIER